MAIVRLLKGQSAGQHHGSSNYHQSITDGARPPALLTGIPYTLRASTRDPTQFMALYKGIDAHLIDVEVDLYSSGTERAGKQVSPMTEFSSSTSFRSSHETCWR